MDIEAFAKDVHNLAREKGFYGLCKDAHDPQWQEYRKALITTELSEAVEEVRRGGLSSPYWVSQDGKPEGWAIELADAAIRILDLTASVGHYPRPFLSEPTLGVTDNTVSFGAQVNGITRLVSANDDTYLFLEVALSRIDHLCSRNGQRLSLMMRIKHEYNKTREFRHGKLG